MNFKHILGIFLIVSGIVMLSGSFSGLTGYAVIEVVNQTATSFFGLVLVIGGIVVLALGTPRAEVRREIEGGLAPLVKKSAPGATPENTEILVDANFLKHIPEEHLKEDFFGNLKHSVYDSVIAEMTRRSGKTRQPLIPMGKVNYLLSNLRTIRITEKPADEERNEIYDIWQNASPKAKLRSEHEKFKKSGDMDTLCYALRKAKTGAYTFILSNDVDIRSVAKSLREKRGVNVYVIETRDITSYIQR